MMLDDRVGKRLKELRERKGYTLRGAGELAGISHTYVSKIEKGQIPSLHTLEKLCELYGVSVQSLFGEEMKLPPELADIGVEWITHVENMKSKELTPREIEELIEVVQKLRGK